MSQICLADIPRTTYTECDKCIDSYLTYSETTYPVVGGQTVVCTLTRKYRWRTCHMGLAVGRHVYSITLLPGEEVELEVVRREKFTTALHEQNSIEQELEFEIQETLREEWSQKSDALYESTKQNNWKVFGQKRQTINQYRDEVALFESTMSEVVSTAAARVSAKYETSIDIKTEVENKYRAVRKVKNPNRCQPVTFHYFQLVKKIRRELFLVEQTYDCSSPAADTTPAPGLTTYRTSAGRPQNLRPRVVAPPPQWTLTEPAVSVTTEAACGDPVSSPIESVITVPFEQPVTKQLSKNRVIADIRATAGDEAAREMQQHLDQIDDIADPSGGGLILSEDICLGTDSFHVEGMVSNCAICEDVELKKEEFECKRIELEIQKLKCEIDLCQVQLGDKEDHEKSTNCKDEKARKKEKHCNKG
ncbi:MAG: hypothetical protein L3J89_06685 [Gammaproteobacteria bacterium]|nr:hypothetical protein [Gammaproteobacteria bacterium]